MRRMLFYVVGCAGFGVLDGCGHALLGLGFAVACFGVSEWLDTTDREKLQAEAAEAMAKAEALGKEARELQAQVLQRQEEAIALQLRKERFMRRRLRDKKGESRCS